jgi:CRP/FNR family cyclic AMP-dependent transcriptional regulator
MHDIAPTDFDAKLVLENVGQGQSTRVYATRRILFAQGEPADAVFYLQRGRIKMSLVSPRGKEAVIAILGSDEFFGEGCLAGQSVRMMTATSIAPSSVVRIEKTAMIRLLHERPAVTQTFIAHLLSRNIRIEEDLTDQLFNSCEKRLARMLLILANFGKESLPEPVIANLSQQTLADMVGTTRSRVSFFMNKFRRLGLIGYTGSMQGDLHVYSSLLNVILHD